MKEVQIIVRTDSELKERVRKAADKLGLDMSSYIRMVIIKAMEQDNGKVSDN
jgi:antitoxin component of RelBE/YafQ-DinJ toxin-antitoxin module